MELVKKNIVSVICGVVAIIAIVASFVPLGGYIENLQSALDSSKGNYSALDGLRTKQRNLPILKLEETTPQPLGMFPSKDVIEKAKAVTKQVEQESIKMRDEAVRMNRRPPLVAGSLPNPSPRDEIAFRDTYVPLVAPPMQGQQMTGEPPRLLQEYKAGVLPLQPVIDAERLRQQNDIMESRVQRDARGQIINQPELTELTAEVNAKVPQQMRRAVAEKSMFYVEVSAQGGVGPTIDVAPGIAGSQRPKPEAIWWAQVMLWVQRDVLEAIKEVNSAPLANGQQPKNLMEAPVKRLARIAIPTMNIFVTAAGQAPAAADPTAAADAALPKVVQASPTGRVSNGMYDVVHFQVVADVEVDKIPQVIRALSHNRLMNVLHVEAKNVDLAAAQLAGYYYNPSSDPKDFKPVAQVTFSCEALFLRHWTAPLMPKAIRTQLQIPDPPAPGAAPVDPAAAPAAVAP